jgi:hypothetical protein
VRALRLSEPRRRIFEAQSSRSATAREKGCRAGRRDVTCVVT